MKIKTRLVRFIFARRALLKHFIPTRSPILIKLPDFKIYVRLDDWAVGLRIAIKRTYDPHITPVIRELLQPGMVMVDIGANIGYYTLLAASRVAREGKVIAFEPSSDNRALLSMSLQENLFGNVVLYPYAVADREGIVGFVVDDSNGAISPMDPSACPLQVQAVTLDTFLSNEPRIDIIKMDIEGAEYLALQGMRQLICHHRPIILTEFAPLSLKATSGITPEVYLNQLRDLGYELFILDAASGPSPTPQSNAQIMQNFPSPTEFAYLDLILYPKNQTINR